MSDNAKKTDTSASSAVASRAANNGAPKADQKATPLMFLNDATRKFASWEVSVADPKMDEYTYIWEGQNRKTNIFKCTLVSVLDETQYCIGEIRKVRGSPADIFEKAKKHIKKASDSECRRWP